MAIFRKIHTSFWSDIFVQSLTPERKYFYLYLLTNERTKQCGIYEITTRQISYDTGYNLDTVLNLLDYFIKSGKIQFSRETNEIAIKNWEKYNGSKSPDVQNLVNKELKLVKNKKITEWLHSVDTVVPLSEKLPRGEPEPEREPELEKKVTNTPTAAAEVVGDEKVKFIANEVWKNQIWKEGVCQALSISIDELKKWMLLFNLSVADRQIEDLDKVRYKRMVRGWIQSQQKKGINVDSAANKNSSSPPLTRL